MSAARPLKFRVQFSTPDDRTKINAALLPAVVRNRIGVYPYATEAWYATRSGAFDAAMSGRRGGFSTHVTEYNLVEANPGGDL